jgi:hypothetical protein
MLVNTTATRVQYRGRDAFKLVGRRPASATPGTPVHSISIVDYEFQDGTIEADVAGVPAAGADTSARGFVGIAFRVDSSGDRYAAFYVRPTNGRAQDQLRRNHSAQYISEPEYPWFRLRRGSPGVYESYVDLEPGALRDTHRGPPGRGAALRQWLGAARADRQRHEEPTGSDESHSGSMRTPRPTSLVCA